MRVLVMGGSYFVGLAIVNKLIEKNYSVTICNRGSKPLNRKGVEELYLDRKNHNDLSEKLKKLNFDYIIDVSGLNKEDVSSLYEATKHMDIKKHIFISSSAVYKPSINLPIPEEAPLGFNPFWQQYGIDKIEAEEFFIEKFKEKDYPFIALRPPYIYGENNYVYREAYVFDHILEKRDLVLPNNGETLVQFLHVGDLANCVVKLLDEDKAIGKIFNIGNKESLTFKQWVELCMEVTNMDRVNIHYYNTHDSDLSSRDFFPFYEYEYHLGTDKLDEFFKVEVNFKEGLKKSFEWYLINKDKVIVKKHIEENEKIILKR